MKTRIWLVRGIAVFALLLIAALLMPRIAATQQLPPASSFKAATTTYTAVGVASTSGGDGTIAWFMALPQTGNAYPVACFSADRKCYQIAFP